MMTRFFSRSLGAMAAFILAAVPAFAATESFQFDLSQTDLTNTSVDSTFNLDAFDPTLGTLTGVSLVLDLSTEATPTVANIATSPGSYTNATTSFLTNFSGPDGTVVTYTATSSADSGTIASSTILTLTGSPVSSNTSKTVASNNFSVYEGTSPLSFSLVSPVGATPFSSSGSSPNVGTVFFGGTGSVGGTAFVEYTFAATPEPSSWLLGLVCVGLFAFLRMRVGRSVY